MKTMNDIDNPTALKVTDGSDENQDSWKIETPTATYFYHKEGAGFSSLLDRHGNDWINYHPFGGSEGAHRGIPNMVFNSNGNYFHPGHTGERGSASTLKQENGRVVIDSVSGNGLWAVRWEIFATHATMEVVKASGAYWFLYEGTPGGTYDPEVNWYLLSGSRRKSVGEDTVGDIPGPEWAVFGRDNLDTVLFLAHHEDDSISDTYMHWDNMTVFGFGRAGREDFVPKMTAAGQHFSIGFLEAARPDSLGDRIAGLIKPGFC